MSNNICPFCGEGVLRLVASVTALRIWELGESGRSVGLPVLEYDSDVNGCRKIKCDECTFEYYNYDVNNGCYRDEISYEDRKRMQSIFEMNNEHCDDLS